MVGADAVAAVACDLIVAGPLRIIVTPAGAGEVEKRCASRFEVCFNARTAVLDDRRSMLTVAEQRMETGRRESRGSDREETRRE